MGHLRIAKDHPGDLFRHGGRHKPCPLVVMDRCYNLLARNRAVESFVEACLGPVDGGFNVLLVMPGIPKDWRDPDFTRGSQAVFSFCFKVGEHRLDFVTTVTSFNTPRNVTLEELRIESYFPANSKTEEICQKLFSDEPDNKP